MDSQETLKVYTTKQEVIERIKELAHGEEMPQKEEMEQLKALIN